MLFMLIGLLAVGWAGVGLGVYLGGDQTTQVHRSYDRVQRLTTHAVDEARKTSVTNELNVRVRRIRLIAVNI